MYRAYKRARATNFIILVRENCIAHISTKYVEFVKYYVAGDKMSILKMYTFEHNNKQYFAIYRGINHIYGGVYVSCQFSSAILNIGQKFHGVLSNNGDKIIVSLFIFRWNLKPSLFLHQTHFANIVNTYCTHRHAILRVFGHTVEEFIQQNNKFAIKNSLIFN